MKSYDINIFCYTLSLIFNVYMLLCGNNALKQKTVHSSMTYYVHVLLYNIAKQNRYLRVNASQLS
jgi:hypothetical protein